jgi:hypothetical protein
MKITLGSFSFKSLSVVAAFALPGAAFANLTVDGTANGSWSNTGTMTYDNTATDPTSQSGGQFELNGGGSLTESSGTLTLTNSQYGAFVGQMTTGTISMSGGTFTWNANGSSEQRFAFGNSGGTGILTMTGGTFNANTGVGTDTSKGLSFGRSGGTGTANLSGTATFVSPTQVFALASGGGTGTITLGLGTPQFILNGLADTTAASFSIGAGSDFNFLSGSGGALELGTGTGAVSQSFFDGLVTSGDILVNGATTTPSSFSYTAGNGLGVYTLTPEPSTWAMLGSGLCLLAGWNFSRRRAVR